LHMTSGILRRISRTIAAQTKYDQLGVPFLRYLLVFGLFTVAGSLSGSYFGVFLLRATGSSMALMKYNLLLACVQPFVMLTAVSVLRHGSVNLCLRVGLMLHALSYVVLTLIDGSATSMVYLVSVISSSGNAFFYTAYTPQILGYTKDDNRDTAYGAIGLFTTVVSLVLPLMTGFFISAFGDLTGYKVLFILSSLILLGGLGASYRLMPLPNQTGVRKSQLRATAKRFFRNKALMQSMGVTMLDSIRTSGSGYFITLLIFELLQKEAVMGMLTAVTAVLSMAVNVAYGRFVTAGNRGRGMLFGSVGALLAVCIVCLYRTATGYVVYSLLGCLVGVFMGNPVITGYMSVVQHDPVLAQNGGEVHALREFFYASGRVLGLLPVFFLPDPAQAAPLMMVLLSALQIPASLMTIALQKKQQAALAQ